MPIDLYYAPYASQCQAVQMVAAALGVPLRLRTVDLAADEQLADDFRRINPQHTIPTLHDNGFAVWETRAILVYLAERYGPADDSPLYPRDDPQQRATINQRLYFDMGTLYQALLDSYYAAFQTGTAPTEASLLAVRSAFGHLDGFIGEPHRCVAGPALTLADFALFATVSMFELAGHDFGRHANVGAWYERLRRTLPGVEISTAGMEAMRAHMAAA